MRWWELFQAELWGWSCIYFGAFIVKDKWLWLASPGQKDRAPAFICHFAVDHSAASLCGWAALQGSYPETDSQQSLRAMKKTSEGQRNLLCRRTWAIYWCPTTQPPPPIKVILAFFVLVSPSLPSLLPYASVYLRSLFLFLSWTQDVVKLTVTS